MTPNASRGLLDTLVGREPALAGEADYQAFRERVGRIAEAADRLERP